MKKDTPFSTYAITLYFDEDTASAIRELTAQLARVTENDYMTVNNVPPHLTVGMFHVSDAEVGKLKTCLRILFRRCRTVFCLSQKIYGKGSLLKGSFLKRTLLFLYSSLGLNLFSTR